MYESPFIYVISKVQSNLKDPFTNSWKTMIHQAMLVILIMLVVAETNSAMRAVNRSCRTSCGNLTIPFRFGTSSNCDLDDSSLIACNLDYNPPKAVLNLGTSEVHNILRDGHMRVASSVARDCYDSTGSQISGNISELASSEFHISSTRNKFIASGCDTHALVQGSEEWKWMSSGCDSRCDSLEGLVSCSGIGASIPRGERDFPVDTRIIRNLSRVNYINRRRYTYPCGAINLPSSDIKILGSRETVPAALGWSVGDISCQEARKDPASFACRATHSECIDSSSGIGYHCICLSGFDGNPYLIHGCRDVNECIALEPCEGTCTNLQGSYSCSCPAGFEGDGRKDGSGCRPKSRINGSTFFYIASGLMVPAVGSAWILWRRKQNKVDRLRRNLFLRNGGRLLEGRVAILTAEDLKQATNNYSEHNLLSGEHYKGMLPDGRMVTVAKCDEIDECNVDVTVNKIISLSGIRHRNVVHLLGCCLETQVPLLVYEFFRHQTLCSHLLYDDRACYLSWDTRLKIAAEAARVIEYMHSCLDAPVIHGSLSSSSILLCNGYNVKIQYYYATNLFNTSVSSGYLDPEYFFSRRLTEKSDVYSFGVILAELLTGQQEFSFDRPIREAALARYFINGKDNLKSILDRRLETDGKIAMLTQVGELVEKCLSESSAHRPTMTQVAAALRRARRLDSSSTTISSETSQERGVRGVVRRNWSF